MINPSERGNYEILRDCLSSPIIQKSALPEGQVRRRRAGKKRAVKRKDGELEEKNPKTVSKDTTHEEEQEVVDDLVEFLDYLSMEIFTCLPPTLRTLSYDTYTSTTSLQETYKLPLSAQTVSSLLALVPPTVPDSLCSYKFLPSVDHLPIFLTAVFENYIGGAIAPPPMWSTTRPAECELCGRDWIPLTYHHLIPRSTHEKVLKKGWHPEWRLNSVAWLCRACHDLVHRIAGNEELAKDWWTLDLLRERDDVQRFVSWVSKVRWKKR
ncbi:MAG: hypothetical protein M1816_007894 [Peltula sp. TS41687]|nr:MAG: hypothetical protein M1816_007894 [Peltula sp. TS41687]